MTMSHTDRRALLRGGTSLGLCAVAAPAAVHAQKAMTAASPKFSGKPYGELFKPTAGGLGIAGPWGEVRAAKLPEGLTPYFIQTANKSGIFDYGGREPVVTFKGSSQEIKLTVAGISIGGGKELRWDKAGVAALKDALKKDRRAMQSAMQMRSVIATSFAALAVASKTAPAKGVTQLSLSVIEDLGKAAVCTTNTVTESVTSLVERTEGVIRTAAERYAKCYDEALEKGTCAAVGSVNATAGQVCAATYCTAKGFVDVVVGFITIVVEVVEEVTREVTTCTAPLVGLIPNEWNLPDIRLPDLPIKEIKLAAKDVAKALEFIRENLDTLFAFLGPYGKCLVEGDWSLAKLNIPFIPGVGIPVGVTVCISAACARSLAVQNLVGESLAAWGAALGALAAFSPEFAAAVPAIIATPEIVAALAALPAAATSAGALILAFIILALLYASAISAQMSLLVQFSPQALADGEVCITHPSIALAAIKAATLTAAPAELVPPIVIG